MAFDMMRAHESSSFPPLLYDLVVRVRPDVAVMPMPNVQWSAWKPFALYDIVYHMDIFAMMMRSVAHAYFSAAEYFVEENCHHLPTDQASMARYCGANQSAGWSSQCFLRTILRKHAVRETGWALPPQIPLRVRIVRPIDLSAHDRVPSTELWPASCTGQLLATKRGREGGG